MNQWFNQVNQVNQVKDRSSMKKGLKGIGNRQQAAGVSERPVSNKEVSQAPRASSFVLCSPGHERSLLSPSGELP
jgi:hypothetical protein